MITLFKKTEQANVSSVCKITRKLSPTLFSVADNTGRTRTAESSSNYRIGDWVVVRNGIIVGSSKKPKEAKHVYV